MFFNVYSELQFLSKNYAKFLKEYFQSQQTQKDLEKPIENVIGKVFDNVRTDIAHAKDMLSALQTSISRTPHVTERYDFALESSGSEIASIGETDLLCYSFSYLFFGPFHIKNAPRLVIQPHLNPGECFAFKGSTGEVTIKLRDWLFVDSVGVDHITGQFSTIYCRCICNFLSHNTHDIISTKMLAIPVVDVLSRIICGYYLLGNVRTSQYLSVEFMVWLTFSCESEIFETCGAKEQRKIPPNLLGNSNESDL